MAQLGGLLGGSIANKLNPPILSPDEQNQGDAVSETQSYMKKFQATNPDATAEELGLETQKTFAQNLLKRGDLRGIPMMQAYAQTKQARAMGEKELEKVGLANQGARNTLDTWDMKNRLIDVWQPGDTQDSPPRTAFIDNQGVAHMQGDDGKEVALPPGQYYTHVPGNNSTAMRNAITPTEAGQIRTAQGAVMKEMKTAMMLHGVLQDSVDKNGSIDFLGKTGEGTNFVTRFVDNVSEAVRSISGALDNPTIVGGSAEGGDLSKAGQALQYVRDKANSAFLSGLDQYMPANVRENSRLREQWLSGVTSMAYTLAMARKPNARQVTDTDVKMAMHTIAANATDPESFRRVMLQDLTNDVDAFNFRLKGIQPRYQKQILGQDSVDEFNNQYAKFADTFSRPFGVGGKPGPGLSSDDKLKAMGL
jgi:hypothetical protein